jgi:hypothetical protein
MFYLLDEELSFYGATSKSVNKNTLIARIDTVYCIHYVHYYRICVRFPAAVTYLSVIFLAPFEIRYSPGLSPA